MAAVNNYEISLRLIGKRQVAILSSIHFTTLLFVKRNFRKFASWLAFRGYLFLSFLRRNSFEWIQIRVCLVNRMGTMMRVNKSGRGIRPFVYPICLSEEVSLAVPRDKFSSATSSEIPMEHRSSIGFHARFEGEAFERTISIVVEDERGSLFNNLVG